MRDKRYIVGHRLVNVLANTDDDSCIFNCNINADCPDYGGQEQYCLVSAGECSTVAGSGGDI
jgi:hypothetical protein